MTRAIALVLLVAGCDYAFGLDHVEREITGRWGLQFQYNNANHAPVLESRLFSPAETTFEVRTDDGDLVPIEYDYAAGTFRFITPTTTYRLIARSTGAPPKEIRQSAPHIETVDTVFSRPDALPAPPGTSLTGTITPALASAHLITTGSWNDLALSTTSPYSVPWTGALLSAAKYDRIYIAGYETVDDASVITQLGVDDTLEMASGVPNTANITPMMIAQPYCANLHVDRTAEVDRLHLLHPELTVGTARTTWGLYATPDAALGPRILLTLAIDRNVGCTDCTMHYSTPFTGFRTLYSVGAQLANPATPFPVTTFAGVSVFGNLEDSITCENNTLASGLVAVATNLRLNGTPLDTNGVEIAIDATAELTWDTEGPYDDFVVELYEARQGSVHGVPVRRVQTPEPRVVFDASDLIAGQPYNVLVLPRIGYPNARAGDYVTVSYPNGASYVSGSVFFVRR